MGDTAPLDGLGVVGINSETDRMITSYGARRRCDWRCRTLARADWGNVDRPRHNAAGDRLDNDISRMRQIRLRTGTIAVNDGGTSR